MKIYKKIICSLILGLSIYSTQALLINEEVFKANGGDLNQIAASLKYANNSLRDKSFKDLFLLSGKFLGVQPPGLVMIASLLLSQQRE